MMPSHQEIKAATYALNKVSAPVPDGFEAFFFQRYWEIVKIVVFKAVLEFFTSSWILPGFNSNIVTLLHKTSNATSIDHYWPIAMINFKFKVLSKIIADMLAKVMPSIISEEQMSFIHDRNIKVCICTISEAVNLLHNKSFGAKDVLSRSISKLVHEGKLDLIRGSRHINVPSHTFYADDLMIFYKEFLGSKLLQARVMRGKKTIHHHIFSSIWSNIKEEVPTILENSIWLLGNGEDINFWNDNWCGSILFEVFNIPFHISQALTSTVSDYLYNGHWNLPPYLGQHYFALSFLVQQVTSKQIALE
ncbi:hypothetical protein TSUD_27870 [Trifolium subterraneum]|uniref:Reverse transcriptase domain-containing protein n=1 Tax=Trifolium subterraneum TaxID=3900 RepID=A0A2Z6P5Z9_TRISU|nr:hypothetical protein TSUD_27870 [Trifolium subterraneum]